MQKISEVGNLLKKTYRIYSNDLIQLLQDKGYLDLRASFLEILVFISENEASSIKQIGDACGLKKQTMTSHLNELERRGYIVRKSSDKDRRELKVFLTEYGQKFKLTLLEVSQGLEEKYLSRVGEVELDRVLMALNTFFDHINSDEGQQIKLL